MTRFAQSMHASTCPPRAAVRQDSMADMTFNCPRLIRPALADRQAEPKRRKISATSSVGRDTQICRSGWRPHLRNGQEIKRAGDLANRFKGDTRIKRRGVEFLMSEQNLNDPDIGLVLEKVGGETVT